MFEVVILNVRPELQQYEFDTLLNLVSLEKQARIRKFHFFNDSRNCLISDILARIEICRTTGFNNGQLEFSTNEYGKPFLINNPHIYFNISHADQYVAFAIADEPVGIDIEIIKPIDLKIANRFFTPDEETYILAGNRVQRFYEIWTKKESNIKWEGKGLYKALTSFSVLTPSEQVQLYYHCIFQNEECISYVCSTKQVMPNIRKVDTSFLLNAQKLLR